MLHLSNVVKKYRSPSGDSTTVLDGVSFDVEAGASVAIIGPSGSGKSTLLNIIGGLDAPNSGKVLLGDVDLARAAEKELTKIRSRDIGFIFQLHHLLPQLTVLENVLLPTMAHGENAGAEERARALLNRVGLGDHLEHVPAQLSGGERQRAAVVRALINKPKLLLADEPTGSLDQASSTNLAELLAELNEEEKVTLLVVSHSLELANKMQQVYELSNGQLNMKHAV